MTNLTVHRNTVERHRKKQLAANAVRDVGEVIRQNDVRAYAFVAIDAQGKLYATFDTGAIIPLWAFSSTVGEGLRRFIEESDVVEDWRPSLPLKGGS